jgi:hypothetical protein
MRVRDNLKQCVCFLCVQKQKHGRNIMEYGGTAFVVGVKSEVKPDSSYIYVVTAKHCVEAAKNSGDLFLRLNTLEGGVELIKIQSEWIYAENEAIDVAVLADTVPLDRFEYIPVPEAMFATDEIIQKNQIGIGDNLIVTGLFTQHYGSQRNLPIIRTGIIASMPDEPLQDPNTGLEYEGYLAEVRLIGGLSGSPVFVVLDPGRLIKGSLPFHHQTFLLGLIRGHWDYRKTSASIDFGNNELEAVNMGMAIVTPARELVAILSSEELSKERRRFEREILRQQAPANQ